MKKIFQLFILVIFVSVSALAQNGFTYKEFYQKTALSGVIDFSKDEH